MTTTMSKTTSIRLGEHFDTFIDEKLKSGSYKNASELIREGLRRIESDEKRLEALRAKLARGEQDYKEGKYRVYESAEELGAAINKKLLGRKTS